MEYISRKKIMFELAVITKESTSDTLYAKDSMGRTRQVTLGESEYRFIKILPYWREEKIYDHLLQTKISFYKMMEMYLEDKDFKQVFTLNNKVVIQKDDKFIYV